MVAITSGRFSACGAVLDWSRARPRSPPHGKYAGASTDSLGQFLASALAAVDPDQEEAAVGEGRRGRAAEFTGRGRHDRHARVAAHRRLSCESVTGSHRGSLVMGAPPLGAA